MKKFLILSCLLFGYRSQSQDVIEWKDVASIFYEQCTVCHRPGEIGDGIINATGYSNLVNSTYFYSIPSAIQTKLMPPWPADPNFRHYLDERILTSEQISKISDWINVYGAPAGDTTLAPPLPEFSDGSQLGDPDTTLVMATAHPVPGDNKDSYYVFNLPAGLTEDRAVQAIEFRPGNSRVVHHVFLYTCDDGSVDSLDALTPEYGYPSFGGAGDGANVNFITLWGPGMNPRFYPEGTGAKFKAGSTVVIQVHYAPTPVLEYDQSYVNIFYAPDNEIRVVKGKRVGEDYITEPVFFILKDKILTFHSEYVLDTTYSLFSIAPHQHLLGKSFKIWAVTPSGDSIPLNYVPEWKFNWQFLYMFPNYVILPKGTVIKSEGVYDNTTNNPNNPNSPPQNVGYGESSYDEMYKYFMNLVVYQPGDEFAVFDTTWQPVGQAEIRSVVSTPQLYDPMPNPADAQTVISYYLPVASEARLHVYDLSGKLALPIRIHQQSAGFHKELLQMNDVPSGTYFCTLETGSTRLTKKIIISR